MYKNNLIVKAGTALGVGRHLPNYRGYLPKKKETNYVTVECHTGNIVFYHRILTLVQRLSFVMKDISIIIILYIPHVSSGS